MRRFQKQQILDVFQSIHTLHGQIKDMLSARKYDAVQTALAECQDAAIHVGEAIEQIEGNGTDAVASLEQYCEHVYQVSARIQDLSEQKAHKMLESGLIKAENDVKHMPERREAVFIPYKVSMWDSLESVWMAADADPDCDAYVIPIPYYDKNKDGSFGTMHYEGGQYPDYVPVINYEDYDFENRHPDMVFFHNPYDQYNSVTSVHPFFYSKNLKRFTDCLVYIPYYCTSGGMLEAQGYALSYYYADYIVLQAESFLSYFDPNLPREKFLPLGSPKFDKVIRLCNHPPQVPEAWKDKMYCEDGTKRKVYFYNTSINGMLANTEQFLKKMAYVFQCFAEHPDACLLWRPHPLLESTFDSMRASYRPVYEKLKQYFFESNIGIYDDTPEIETTIALCDAYIGDSGTSVTSLFGVAGKPVFILNNRIDSKPEEDDWRGEIIKGIPYPVYGDRRWMITQGNRLYYSPENDFRYRYYCDLPGRMLDCDYSAVLHVNGKDYVCPAREQKILVAADGGIQQTIVLEPHTECSWAFRAAAAYGKYLFLIPNEYPALVRYDTESGQFLYLREHMDIGRQQTDTEWRTGGFCITNGCLYLASPVDDRIVAVDVETGAMSVRRMGGGIYSGCCIAVPYRGEIWLLPHEGYAVGRWDPKSGTMREYRIDIEELVCKDPNHDILCDRYPFSYPAFSEEYVYLPPYWANMFIRIHIDSGEVQRCQPTAASTGDVPNGYYVASAGMYFVPAEADETDEALTEAPYLLFSNTDRRMYQGDPDRNQWKEIEIDFVKEELRQHIQGFTVAASFLRYACMEDSWNTLADLLEDRITGGAFSREDELESYGQIVANIDGTCGDKVYQFVKNRL